MREKMLLFGLLWTALLSACAGLSTTSPATSVPLSTIAPTSTSVVELEKVTFAIPPAPRTSYLPIMLAQVLGLYQQEGLDITLVPFSACHCDPELILGEQVDFIKSDPPVAAQAEAKEWRMIVSLGSLPGYTLLARSDLKDQIKTVSDLREQFVTVEGTPGNPAYLPMKSLIVKAGLAPNDVKFNNIGHSPDYIAGMIETRIVDVTLNEEPETTRLIPSGKAYALIDLTTKEDTFKWLGGEHQFGVVTTAELLKNRPQTVQKMTNAIVKALRYIATHRAEDIVVLLPEDVTGKDKTLFLEALKRTLPIFSKDGLISEAGVKNVIDLNRLTGTIQPDQRIDVNALYTNDFVKNVK